MPLKNGDHLICIFIWSWFVLISKSIFLFCSHLFTMPQILWWWYFAITRWCNKEKWGFGQSSEEGEEWAMLMRIQNRLPLSLDICSTPYSPPQFSTTQATADNQNPLAPWMSFVVVPGLKFRFYWALATPGHYRRWKLHTIDGHGGQRKGQRPFDLKLRDIADQLHQHTV